MVDMSSVTVPLDTMVPISTFSRGGASSAFGKVSDGVPVTVMKNNQPAYIVISTNDYQRFCENEERLASIEAREQAFRGEGETFDSIDDLMADLHA